MILEIEKIKGIERIRYTTSHPKDMTEDLIEVYNVAIKNDPELTKKVRGIACDVLGEDHVHDLDLRMTAEDFAFYSHLVPVCFFRLGVGNKAKGITYNVHQSKFDIDHNAMKSGLKLFYSIAFLLDP